MLYCLLCLELMQCKVHPLLLPFLSFLSLSFGYFVAFGIWIAIIIITAVACEFTCRGKTADAAAPSFTASYAVDPFPKDHGVAEFSGSNPLAAKHHYIDSSI